MGLNILDANLIALLALVMSSVTGFLSWRSNAWRDKRAADTAGATAVVEAYDKLCADLEKRIEQNRVDTLALQAELRDLKAQHAIDQELWQKERVRLEIRIEYLQTENAKLKSRLDALQGTTS